MLTREQLPVRLTPMVGRESELSDRGAVAGPFALYQRLVAAR